MDNDKLKKAIEYARANPQSEFATELQNRITRGEFNTQLKGLGVDTTKFEAPKKQGILKRIGSALIRSEKRFGESIAGAIIPFTSQNILDEARERQNQTETQLIKTIQERRAKGEDVTRLLSVLKDLSGQKIMSDEELNPALLKTNKQILGEALGVATDIIGAGTIGGKAVQTIKQPTSFLKGSYLGAKTGLATGAGIGTAQGVATGMQENLDAGGIAVRGISGGIVGGATGATVGGLVGGVSGGLRGRSLRKQELNDLIAQGDISDARLAESGLQQVTDPQTGQATFKITGKDKVATEAIKQGFDDADVAIVKTASPSDKSKMSQMFNIAEKASRDRRVVERPFDVVGESFLKPVNELNKRLNGSIKKLDTVAQGLKNKGVNSANDVIASVNDDLAGMGAKLKNNGAIDFAGSDLEGLGANEKLLSNVYRRILSAKDAYDFHRIKRFIDANVDYGKGGEGLTGQAESMLKGWRRLIDQSLDTQFTDYNKVNTQISDVFNLLDELNSVMGRKFRVGDTFANVKAGQVTSRLLGNNASRGDILRIIKNIADTSKKYGVKTDEDIISQVVFADMLEDLFGTQATRGLQGQTKRAIEGAIDTTSQIANRNLLGATIEIGKKGIEVARGVNQESKIKALKALLGV